MNLGIASGQEMCMRPGFEYAATNPVEDIAESWTEFVMRPKPIGTTIADQKEQFFYEYPELVKIRREILQGVCKYASEQK